MILYIQGEVYGYTVIGPDEWLMTGTYREGEIRNGMGHHCNHFMIIILITELNPYNMAARDVGNLLKKVLSDNEYRYYKSRKKRTKEYKEIEKKDIDFFRK